MLYSGLETETRVQYEVEVANRQSGATQIIEIDARSPGVARATANQLGLDVRTDPRPKRPQTGNTFAYAAIACGAAGLVAILLGDHLAMLALGQYGGFLILVAAPLVICGLVMPLFRRGRGLGAGLLAMLVVSIPALVLLVAMMDGAY
jgi:hypothetical protein